MIVVSPALDVILDFVGEQNGTKSNLRWSSFSFKIYEGSNILLFNTLTKELLSLTSEKELEGSKCELFRKWFYVDEGFDEVAFVDKLRSLYSITKETQNGFDFYTILTTTNCNARCFYCYEKSQSHRDMTLETANDIVRYVKNTKKDGSKIMLNWLGGEPLFNSSVISIICDGLKRECVDFSSTMVSNGFLFNSELVSVAKEKWNLESVQVTLDGTENIYNRVKAYVDVEGSAFKKVIENIFLLLGANVRVTIRLNVDFHNLADLNSLIEYLAGEYDKYDNFTVYAVPLFEENDCCRRRRTSEQRIELYEKVMEMNKQILYYGMSKPAKISKEFVFHQCMADGDDSIMIMPDGYIGKCTRYTDSNYIGHINDVSVDKKMLLKYRMRRKIISECKTCSLYPDCIRLEMCQEQKNCYKEYRDARILGLSTAIRNEYKAYLEREKNKE